MRGITQFHQKLHVCFIAFVTTPLRLLIASAIRSPTCTATATLILLAAIFLGEGADMVKHSPNH